MLLLRVTLGLTAIVEGVIYLADWNHVTLGLLIVGILAAASGALLLIGFLTPVISGIVCFGNVVIALLGFTAPVPSFSDSNLFIIYIAVIAAALVLLGPGAISLDARLFGRREIIIPSNPRPPKF